MVWYKPDAIRCDVAGCGATFTLDEGPRVEIVYSARAHGWHCYRGPSVTNKELDTHVCPRCAGTPPKLPSSAEPLDGDEPLFDIDGAAVDGN